MAIKIDHRLNELSTDNGSIKMQGTGALQVPVGVSGDRPIADDGQIRYNSANGKFEFKETGLWNSYTDNVKYYVQSSAVSAPVQQVGNIIMYNRTITTASADVTVNVTTDGTFESSELFNNLSQCHISINPIDDTDSDDAGPWCYIRQITAKTIRFQIKRSNTETLLIGDGDFVQGNRDNNTSLEIQINVTGLEKV